MLTLTTREDVSGLYVPLVTPFDESGSLDIASLAKLSEHLVSSAGVTGLVTCARIGEGPVLSVEEQVKVTEIVKGAAGGKQVIGSILPSTEADAAEQIDKLRAVGADAVMVFPPLLLGWGEVPDEVKVEFFTELDRLTTLPLVLFQTPMLDYRFSVDAIREIAGLKNVIAMKEASFDMNAFEATMVGLQQDGSDMPVLNGNDRFVALGSVLGAKGSLIGIANLVPDAWAELHTLATNGQVDEALERERALRDLQDAVFCEPILDAVARIKAILVNNDVIGSSHVRRPQLGISKEETTRVLKAYQEFTTRATR